MQAHIPDGIKGHIDELAQGINIFESYVKDLEGRAAAAKGKAEESDKIDAQIIERRAELVKLESKVAELKQAHAAFAKLANG